MEHYTVNAQRDCHGEALAGKKRQDSFPGVFENKSVSLKAQDPAGVLDWSK